MITLIYFNIRWYLTTHKKLLIKYLFLELQLLFTMRVFVFLWEQKPPHPLLIAIRTKKEINGIHKAY